MEINLENKKKTDSSNIHPKVVACIPAYNEEQNIARVIIGAQDNVDHVIVCDDGSTDLTGIISERLGATIIRNTRNKGYGYSLRNLFKEALNQGADYIVTLDGDAQHEPMQIPILIDALEGSDIVIGSRFLDGGNSEAPPWRDNGIKIITSLSTNSDLGITDAQSGFRAYRRTAIESLPLTEDGMGISTEILLKAEDLGLRIAEVPVKIKYSEDSSTHNPIIHGLEVLFSTFKHLSTRKPLFFYGLPGLLALLTGIFFWAWSLKIFTTIGTISTNIALVALTGTIIGLILITTAIILWVVTSVVREVT
jgi:glycosyltransferase involved in cell wall biosynthesis